MPDISKKTLAVLLVLAIVLSAIATWQILNRQVEASTANSTGIEEIRIEISNSPSEKSTGDIFVKIA